MPPDDFRLHREETLEAGVRRIFISHANEALRMLEDPDVLGHEKTVHEVRKRCKEIRGLLRLVRPALGGSYQITNQAIRDAGRALAPIRDPQALLATFQTLVVAKGPSIEGVGVVSVRKMLVERAAAATDAIDGPERHRLEEARSLLLEACAGVPHWSIPDHFEPIAGGVRRTYRRGRKAMASARSKPSTETFHQWRKRVKYLWYQTTLLEESAPSVLGPLATSLHDLSDALGDAHDLAVLQRSLGSRDDQVDPQELVSAQLMAKSCRDDLEERSLRLGSRLYVEKPKHFTARLGGYWDAWEEGAELTAGEIDDVYGS